MVAVWLYIEVPVAIGAAEEPPGMLRVRASASQAQRLVAEAGRVAGADLAVEGAGGLGHLLAQQLAVAGERVLDVRARLGAWVRLLATGQTNKNDLDDALPVAVAAPRSKTRRQVSADDYAAVLKVWPAAPGPGPGQEPGRVPGSTRCGIGRVAVR